MKHTLYGMVLLCGSLALSGCAAIGSAFSPYKENFTCKNPDHGQCIHPAEAYDDAVMARPSHSDAAVSGRHADRRDAGVASSAYADYRSSVYRELQRLIEAPVTPMLNQPKTVRTLILPYAERQRPDRLYMPRYVYSLLDRPSWVVGDYLVDSVEADSHVLEQIQTKPGAAK